MLEYGINRTGKIVEIEPVDQDIVRWTGRFDQGDPNQNFFTITQSQKDHYTIMQIFTEKGNYSAEIKDGVGLVQTMDEVLQIRSYIMIIHRGINDFGREKKSVRSLSVRI